MVPSMDDLQKMSLDKIKAIYLTKVRWDDDGHKLYNLQFTFSDGSICPAAGTYDNEDAIENE